jgi:Flp pilus assembly protein TadG
MRLNRSQQRSGATIVECALVFPVVIFFILGIVVGALGIFRYQQVRYLAREGARYASTHAGQYQQENAAAIAAGTLPDVNEDYIKSNAIAPNAALLDPANLSVSVNINTSCGNYDWDDTANNNYRWPNSPKKINQVTYNETNTVSVTVTYTWMPEVYLLGPITLTSTAVMPISY